MASIDHSRYFDIFLPVIWRDFLADFVTCFGRYDLARVELAPRWLIDGQDVMKRDLIFTSNEQVVEYCKKSHVLSLQMGAVLPLYGQTSKVDNPSSWDAARQAEVRAKDRELLKQGYGSAYGPLVLDIDVDDYDREGVCHCQSKSLCNRCWDVFMQPARLVINYLMRKVFGLKRLLHVWSGRRGFHVWCFDPQVLEWSREQRTLFIRRIAALRHGDEGFDHVVQQILRPVYEERNLRPPVVNWDLQPRDAERMVVERLFPKFDFAVTEDQRHLKTLPFTLHVEKGTFRLPLPPAETHPLEFRPEKEIMGAKPSKLALQDIQVFFEPCKKMLTE